MCVCGCVSVCVCVCLFGNRYQSAILDIFIFPFLDVIIIFAFLCVLVVLISIECTVCM